MRQVFEPTRLARFRLVPRVAAFRTTKIVHVREKAVEWQKPGVDRLALWTLWLDKHCDYGRIQTRPFLTALDQD